VDHFRTWTGHLWLIEILKGPSGFLQGYNCQAAVDADAQVIVAHATSNEQNDALQNALGVRGPELMEWFFATRA
jgi:hypothetical protein